MDNFFTMLTIKVTGRLVIVIMLLTGLTADVCFMIRYIYKVLRKKQLIQSRCDMFH
jgi:hypothetical protein